MVAAVMTYRVLRRSLTLVMENCTVAIPTIASMYCQQVQLSTVWQLILNILWHRSSRQVDVRQSTRSGKLRLAMQTFACTYVLLFATLVSIMTGYRAQLTGYYGYDAGQVSELQPTSQLSPARMVIFDGSRIGLLDSPTGAIDALSYLSGDSRSFRPRDIIDDSRDFRRPYGILADCEYHSQVYTTKMLIADAW